MAGRATFVITEKERELLIKGVRPEGYDTKKFNSARARLKSQGVALARVEVPFVNTKGKATEAELALCMLGIRPVGWSKNRMHLAQNRLRASGKKPDTSPHEFRDWTPEEDLLVVDGFSEEYPEYVSFRECERRRIYLKENFVDCGWASLIGTKTICEERKGKK